MTEKLVKLPEREEMLARLRRVNQSRSAEEHFYPWLLEHVGAELTGYGIVIMLKQALTKCASLTTPEIIVILCAQAPSFIEALVDDPDIARNAKTTIGLALA